MQSVQPTTEARQKRLDEQYSNALPFYDMLFAEHLVAERTHGASLEPSLDAVKVEHMTTAAEGD